MNAPNETSPSVDAEMPDAVRHCDPAAERSGLSVADLFIVQAALETALDAVRKLVSRERCHAAPQRSHSPDFASVNWHGSVFTFSPKQRTVIATLWRAMEDGYHYVGGDALLVEAESDCKKLRTLFGDHPAWGRFVVVGVTTGGKSGTYRLAPTVAS